jgi:hypothetical protein
MRTSDNLQSVYKQTNLLDVGKLARKSVQLYPHKDYTDRRAVNTLRRGWISKIIYLGDKWLLAKSVPRREMGAADVDAMVAQVVIGLTVLGLIAGWF